MKNRIVLLAALTIISPVYAEPVNPAVAGSSVMTDGVVRRIDVPSGKITLRHGPIVNLDMPGMTMVFRAQPVDILNTVKVGDAVKFHAERINGALTVTAIQPAK
jgi:Cu(I)/Ag(I) efflux system protein CusF